MIIEPNITELSVFADCRYTLVVEASKRSRELIAGYPPLIDTVETKPLSVAVREIVRGKIEYYRPEEAQ